MLYPTELRGHLLKNPPSSFKDEGLAKRSFASTPMGTYAFRQCQRKRLRISRIPEAGGGRRIRTFDDAEACRLKRPDRSSTPVIPPWKKRQVGAIGIEPICLRLRGGPDFHFQARADLPLQCICYLTPVWCRQQEKYFLFLFFNSLTQGTGDAYAAVHACATTFRSLSEFGTAHAKRPRNPRPSKDL